MLVTEKLFGIVTSFIQDKNNSTKVSQALNTLLVLLDKSDDNLVYFIENEGIDMLMAVNRLYKDN